ncbi:MAG TPA: energy transducer TonB [Desulfatiglandales bacterium]|nr:energy transducer TonB [Desulfatiglandales bacterium]
MSTYEENHNIASTAGIFSALIVTIIIFVILPLLTQIPREKRDVRDSGALLINVKKAEKPPPKKTSQLDDKPKELTRTQQQQKSASAPKFEFSSSTVGANLSQTLAIGNISKPSDLKDTFRVSSSLYDTAFNLTEVDTPPQVIRQIEPQYPFQAKKNNIEGSATLRFIVNTNGDVVEPKISKSEPPDIFDEAALQAIVKFKFKPAVKNGRPVDVIVVAPMKFELR